VKPEERLSSGAIPIAYEIKTCFGAKGCPNSLNRSFDLIPALEEVVKNSQLDEFIKNKLKNQPLRPHHRLKVSVSDCPNGCSQLYIADFGLHGFVKVKWDSKLCNFCEECVHVCEEEALKRVDQKIRIDRKKCVGCGACIKACPNGVLKETFKGYKIYVGGKLGRHPRLASFLTYALPEEIPVYLEKLLSFYKEYNEKGERTGTIIEKLGWQKAKKLILTR